MQWGEGKERRAALFAGGAASVVLFVVLVIGCGGGGDDGGTADASEETPRGVSLSRSEFIKEAGAACRRARRELERDVARFLELQEGKKPRPVLYADLTRLVLLPAIEAEMEAIRFLGVPPSETKRIDEILIQGEFVINELVYEERIASIDAVYRAFADVQRMFRAYGLPACVNGSKVTAESS